MSASAPIAGGGIQSMLSIVHISDTEGRVGHVWSRVEGCISALRAQGQADLLLHAGDAPLGGAESRTAVDVMNRLRFDAVALGNHDLDFGVGALQERAAILDAPILCANVDGFLRAVVRPYAWFERRGYRVAVIGITLPDLPAYQAARHTAGLTFYPPADVLGSIVPTVRDRAHIVILLSHAGYEQDLLLAKRVPGIDLIVGGHDHRLLSEPLLIEATTVSHVGARGEHVGLLTVDLGAGRPSVRGSALGTSGVASKLSPQEEGARLPPVGGRAAAPDPPLRLALAGETPLGNLTVDLMRAYARTDVALLRCASVNGELGAGPIDPRDVPRLNTCGHDQIARLHLTGEELVATLECGARESYFLLLTSGARVTYDASRRPGRRVRDVLIGSDPHDPARRYSVACSEVLARGIGGFAPLRGKPHEVLPQTLEDVLHRYATGQETVRTAADGRLRMVGRLPVAREDDNLKDGSTPPERSDGGTT